MAEKEIGETGVIPIQEKVREAATNTKLSQACVNAANAGQASEEVRKRVCGAAGRIADGLVEAAAAGQLATAKYLFEVAGIYPLTEKAKQGERSLAHILLERLGLPTEPMTEEAEPEAEILGQAAERRADSEVSMASRQWKTTGISGERMP